MPARKFKPSAFWAVPLLILLGTLAYAFVEVNRPVPLPPLPNPNGDDDFVKAQRVLVGNPADFQRGSLEELRKLVAENAQALTLVREGLTKQCRVPKTYSVNDLISHSLSDVKRVALLLEAESRLALLEGNTNAAARMHMNTIRYSQEACRGGIIVERLVGIACENIGVNSLQKMVGTLDAATCRALSKELQAIERRKESAKDVLRNESEWVRRSFPVWQRLPGMIPIESLNPTMVVRKHFTRKYQQSEIPLKRLIVDLATRAHELDRGHPPKSLTELVPDYLDTVPVIPAPGAEPTNAP